MSYQRFAGATVGEERQFAIKISCEKQGCSPPHGDNGQIFLCGDPMEAAKYAREGLGGHAYELVTRVVSYPEWEGVDEETV